MKAFLNDLFIYLFIYPGGPEQQWCQTNINHSRVTRTLFIQKSHIPTHDSWQHYSTFLLSSGFPAGSAHSSSSACLDCRQQNSGRHIIIWVWVCELKLKVCRSKILTSTNRCHYLTILSFRCCSFTFEDLKQAVSLLPWRKNKVEGLVFVPFFETQLLL